MRNIFRHFLRSSCEQWHHFLSFLRNLQLKTRHYFFPLKRILIQRISFSLQISPSLCLVLLVALLLPSSSPHPHPQRTADWSSHYSSDTAPYGAPASGEVLLEAAEGAAAAAAHHRGSQWQAEYAPDPVAAEAAQAAQRRQHYEEVGLGSLRSLHAVVAVIVAAAIAAVGLLQTGVI